jgi:hypothetical protein
MLVKGRHALSEFGGGCGALFKRNTQMESKVIGWRAESMLVKGRHALSEFGGGCGAMFKISHKWNARSEENELLTGFPSSFSPIIESQKGVGKSGRGGN